MISPLRYPTKLVFIDDDEFFLDSLASIMNFSTHPTSQEYYTNPKEALDVINRNASPSAVSRCLEYHTPDHIMSEKLEVSLSHLIEEAYNPDRFGNISVVFADYDMDLMHGLDLLGAINDSNIIKVLISGRLTNEDAVNAFNKGQINGFFEKTPALFNQLEKFVYSSINNYFLRLTDKLRFFLKNSSAPLTTLEDSQFEVFFEQLLAREGIVEYYAIENPGSFLLINKDRQIKMLWTRSQSQQDALAFLAQQRGLDKGTVKSIERGELIVCRPYDFDLSSRNEKDFMECLKPATPLKGSEIYYVAEDEDLSSLSIN
ncbi:MAG: hypothetical protein A2007_00250, partial [Verrucomicrobia bacterium GWC2_42_7]